MSTAILILIILITIVYVSWPYLFERINMPGHQLSDDSGQLLELIESRDNMLSTIKDLEFDYDIGKLTTEDFTKMNAQYRNKAIDLFRKIELYKKGGKDNSGEKSKPGIRTKNEKNLCSICNYPSNKVDRFCRNCGNQLNHQ